MAFELQILHASDLEGGVDAIANAPNFAAVVDALDDSFANTVILSAGDNYLSGPFFSASGDIALRDDLQAAYQELFDEPGLTNIREGGGRIDVSIMNIIGFDASAVGNHEFDLGAATFASIIGADVRGPELGDVRWLGAQFPYLSANLDFSGDPGLAPLATDDLLFSDAFALTPAEAAAGEEAPALASAALIDVNGETIGVVGATTQLLEQLSSPGGTTVVGPHANDMDALAAILQPIIDAAAAQTDKIILVSHLQQIALETELAGKLKNVDVIIAGGSDTLLADGNDPLRAGDAADDGYPRAVADADGDDTLIVSTDGEYSYVGRLVVRFDDDGHVDVSALDDAVNGAFATDDAGVARAGRFGLALTEAAEVHDVPDAAATGAFDVDVDAASQSVVIHGRYQDLTSALNVVGAVDSEGNPASAIHLHNAAAGANGAIIRNFTVTDHGDGGGWFSGAFTLSEGEFAAFIAGETYVNLHTADNPAGELRGQVVAQDLFAEGTSGAAVKALTDAVADVVLAKDGETFGETDVFLEGRREAVRTQETNLGDLTADANLAAAKAIDPTVAISIKNGGGIRAPIGEIQELGDGDAAFLPPQANADAGKEAGEVSLLDIENALRFDNQLTLVDLSVADLKIILEHAVANSGEGNTPGRFGQFGGLHFSFDVAGTAQGLDENGAVTTAGDRVKSIALVDERGATTQVLFADGGFVADPAQEIRAVALNFIVDGGDGYPFPALGANIVETGVGEQQALAQYLAANFPVDGSNAFDQAETGVGQDARIQQIGARSDTVDAPVGAGELNVARLGAFDSGAGAGGSEVVAFDVGSARMFTTNGADDRIDVVDLSDPANPTQVGEIDLTSIPNYAGVQSVAAKNGMVAAAVDRGPDGANGVVAVYDATTLAQIHLFEVGNLPDMVTFTPDGAKILVAGEGEPTDDGDPMGTIGIIDVATQTVTLLDFSAFDDQIDALREAGVRIFPDKAPSTDFEPEYIAVSPDGATAFVTLQEANAVAVVDLVAGAITNITPLGAVDHSVAGFGFDASDRDGAINIAEHPVFGLRMPDSIAAFAAGGAQYYVTANEGDARDEDARVKNVALDPTAFPNAAALQEDAALGRLGVSTIDGDVDGDGDLDALYSYGGRGFTIFNAAGDVVFDSGDQFETIIAERFPDLFNGQNGDADNFDRRSDNKGPEPEAVAVGDVGGRTYAFIGLERVGGVMVYNVSDPANAQFVDYLPLFEDGDLSPEVLKFVSAEESPNGTPLLLAAHEISGTTVVLGLDSALGPQAIEGANGDDVLIGGPDDDVISGMGGDDFVKGGPGGDMIALGVGASLIEGALRDLDGDRIDGFDGDDALRVADARIPRDQITRADGADAGGANVVLSFDGDGDGVGDSAVTLTGDFSGGDFMAATAAGQTQVTFETFLPDLSDGRKIDAAQINGVLNPEYLTGDGIKHFEGQLRDLGVASNNNVLGVYEVDGDGDVVDTRILINNANADKTATFTIDGVEDGHQLGFFLVQDAAKWANRLNAGDILSFIDANGAPANVADGAGIALAVNGVDARRTVFHSFDADLNGDGRPHALSGVDAGGASLTIGFEDLTGGGDMDFEDVAFTLKAVDALTPA